LFDIKHDPGGMVDIEFIVQYLVLAQSAHHPALLDNVGNIALLARSAAAGLIDGTLAAQVAQAYRDYRRLQHRMRLNDSRYARIEPSAASGQRRAVETLWRRVLVE
jgi:glutamate-ammonia-ligase adenylyltransferase